MHLASLSVENYRALRREILPRTLLIVGLGILAVVLVAGGLYGLWQGSGIEGEMACRCLARATTVRLLSLL